MNRAFKYYKKGEEPLRYYLQSIRNEDLEKLHQKIIYLQNGRGRIMFGMFAGVPQKTCDWKTLQKICTFVENEINKRNAFRLNTILEVFEEARHIIQKGLQEGLTTSEYSSLTSSLACACRMINEYNLSMDTVWNKNKTTSDGMRVITIGSKGSGKARSFIKPILQAEQENKEIVEAAKVMTYKEIMIEDGGFLINKIKKLMSEEEIKTLPLFPKCADLLVRVLIAGNFNDFTEAECIYFLREFVEPIAHRDYDFVKMGVAITCLKLWETIPLNLRNRLYNMK